MIYGTGSAQSKLGKDNVVAVEGDLLVKMKDQMLSGRKVSGNKAVIIRVSVAWRLLKDQWRSRQVLTKETRKRRAGISDPAALRYSEPASERRPLHTEPRSKNIAAASPSDMESVNARYEFRYAFSSFFFFFLILFYFFIFFFFREEGSWLIFLCL
jgi:hypothetical protein